MILLKGTDIHHSPIEVVRRRKKISLDHLELPLQSDKLALNRGFTFISRLLFDGHTDND